MLFPQKEKPPPPSEQEIFERLRELNAHRTFALSIEDQKDGELWRHHDRAFQECQVWFSENHIPIYYHPKTNKWHIGTRAG